MQPNDIVDAGVLPNDRTYVVLADGSRWEWIPEDGRGWERVHHGLPGVAWQPTESPKHMPSWAGGMIPDGVL